MLPALANLPFAQLWHAVSPAAANFPGSQILHWIAPLVDDLPPGHTVQLTAPEAALKRPRAHAVQVDSDAACVTNDAFPTGHRVGCDVP